MDRKTAARGIGSVSDEREKIKLPEGVQLRRGARGDRLRIVFQWRGEKRRETLDIEATAANIRYAARKRAEVLNAIERGTFEYAEFFPNSKQGRRHAPKRQRFEALFNAYIEQLRTAEASGATIASYRRWYNARIAAKWGEHYIDEMETVELRKWIIALAKELAPKSVRNCVGVLSTVLSQASTDGVIAANPLAPIKFKKILPPKSHAEEDHVDPFNDAEIAAILKACRSPEERHLWQFAFATGLRTGELIALKWKNIDWQRHLIVVKENIVRAEKGTVEKRPKTRAGMREVPILPAARSALEAMRPRSYLAGEHVFVHPLMRGRWLHDAQLHQAWVFTLKRARVRYRNPYQTRHTFASKLLEAGERELVVATLLGHTSVEMVRRHYGRVIKQPDGIKLAGDYSRFALLDEQVLK